MVTYGQVRRAASVTILHHRVDQTSADSEVAQLHLSFAVDQNVGWFHIAMHDRVIVFQIVECFHGLASINNEGRSVIEIQFKSSPNL